MAKFKILTEEGSVFLLEDGGFLNTEEEIVEFAPATNKEFTFKLYTSAGVFISSWNDVISQVVFSETINGGLSELRIELARLESDFGENSDVDFGNIIKVYAHDDDTVLIYSGKLVSYTPKVDGRKETVEVLFYSFYWELQQYLLESGGATEITYNSYEPGEILKDLLDKFTTAGGTADYTGGTVEDTATTVSYTFNTVTYQDALKKVIELCPEGWYFRVGEEGVVYLKSKSATADHDFTIGRDISIYTPEKRIDAVVNTVYFRGDGVLYKKYTNSSSITEYGTMAKSIVDNRVSVEATADSMAGRILDEQSAAEIRVQLKILDNNGETGDGERGEHGYDIETIHVGDTCRIKNVTEKGTNLWDEMLWEIDAWDYDITNAAAIVLQIMKKTYHPDYVILELSNRQPDIAKRIEDINRNLNYEQTKDNPTSPS